MFRLMLGEEELGRSRLEGLNDGMGVAVGAFTPSTAYVRVAPLFRRMTEAMEAGADLSEFFRARDALDLRILGPDGMLVPTEFVAVRYFGDELDREIEVKLPDLRAWNRAHGRTGAG